LTEITLVQSRAMHSFVNC